MNFCTNVNTKYDKKTEPNEIQQNLHKYQFKNSLYGLKIQPELPKLTRS